MISLEELVRRLHSTPGKVQATLHAIGKNLGPRFVKAAKAKFGRYQPAIGPFPGWAALSQYTIEDKISGGFPTPYPLLRTGSLRDSINYESEVKGSDELVIRLGSNDPLMEYHEKGFDNTRTGTFVPPRPVVGPAAWEVSQRVAPIIGVALAAAMSPEFAAFSAKTSKLAGGHTMGYKLRSNSKARR